MERFYQIFITVDDEGNITTAEMGRYIIRLEPCDFFFVVNEEEYKEIEPNIKNYKVALNGYRSELVLKESVEETPTETPTEPTN
ncbi:hypothetical protein ACEPPU_24055 [Priestia aryabhattai]|uniref:hypothetical protein n=1 Tax=Priestia aryabhattai TaxID=412384 RepID=UPI0035ABF27B